MQRYVLRKIISLFFVIFGITLIAFIIGIFTPGDPAEIAMGAGEFEFSKADLERVREMMGLNKPYYLQYLSWLNGVLHWDFGISYTTKQPVINEILKRLPTTFKLALLSLSFSATFGIILGVVSVFYKDSFFDKASQFLAALSISVPGFWIALILIDIFALKLRLLPTSGFSSPKHLILPVLSLSLGTIGTLIRLVRSNLLNELSMQYINVAKSKGLSKSIILIRHALSNSLIPAIAYLGNNFGSLLGGSIIVETIFAINGLGKFGIDSINLRDYPSIQGYVLVTGFIYVCINILVDMTFFLVNPKIKLGAD